MNPFNIFKKRRPDIRKLQDELNHYRLSDFRHRIELDILVNTPNCHEAEKIRLKYQIKRRNMDDAIKAMKN